MKKSLILLALAALPMACGGGSEDSGASAAATAGKALFTSYNCVSCHGENGKGDGIAAAGLDPKPRNYTDAAWQAEVTDAHIKKVIMEGGPASGLSASMPPHKMQIGSKVEDLDNIVAYIRSLGGK
jgi:mono/diheme cytochrome c family protein